MEADVLTAVNTAFSGVADDIISLITTNLPIVLGVAGTIVAITIGWKFVKRFLK